MSIETSLPPRRVGRPRATGPQAFPSDARDDVLRAAAVLFVEKGYAETSTRQIADTVGLRQASLFHYFEKKEDILAELLDRTLRPAIAFARWLADQAGPGPTALHALVWTDVYNLSTSPNNLASLQLLPEARQARFDAFWRTREELRQHYGTQIRASLVLPATDDAVEIDLVFGLVESVLMPYPSLRQRKPDDVASSIAAAALRIALVTRHRAMACAEASRGLRQKYASTSILDDGYEAALEKRT